MGNKAEALRYRTVPEKAAIEDETLASIQRVIRRSHLKEERNERVYSSFYLKFIQHILATHERRIEGIIEGMRTIVEYDGIPVVKFNKETIWLNHGGRMTPTIRRRMNETAEQFGLAFLVYRNGYRDAICWQVETPSGKVIEWEGSNPLAMEIHFPR